MGTTLLSLLGIALTALLALLLVPVLVLLVQVLAAKPGADDVPAPSIRPRATVLMPAHDEAAGIAAAIRSVLAQLGPGDRLLVVADNCSDDTATVAKAAGADVVERRDPARRGKGYALDFGVRHLAASPPELVIIIDADCLLGPACLARLAQACARTALPVQALYLMRAPAHAGLQTRLAELAWVVKNHVRPLGYARLGLPCQLMGTGMALPWGLIRRAPLASGHIVEDMQLGLDLARAGTPPLFCPQALVSSIFPADAAGLDTQRTRWEHGHLGVITSHGPQLLWHALLHGQPQLAALALDLCVPPLAALALMLAMGVLGALALLATGGIAVPTLLGAASIAFYVFSILLAWRRFGQHIVSLREMLSVPGYVLAKLPMYAQLFRGRQAEWVRTRRDHEKR